VSGAAHAMSGTWHDLVDQLTPKQIGWLTEFESQNKPAEDLLETANRLASIRWERLDITAAVTAALEGSGLQADSYTHQLWAAQTTLGAMGLEGLSAIELVALNALLAPAHGRFLISARVEGRRQRGESRRRRPKSGTGSPPLASD
jgi:hypothetical protein